MLMSWILIMNSMNQNAAYFMIFFVPFIFGLMSCIYKDVKFSKSILSLILSFPLVTSAIILCKIMFSLNPVEISVLNVLGSGTYILHSLWTMQSTLLSLTLILIFLIIGLNQICQSDNFSIRNIGKLLLLNFIALVVINSGDIWTLVISWTYFFIYNHFICEDSKKEVLYSALFVSIGLIALALLGATTLNKLETLFVTCEYSQILTLMTIMIVVGILTTLSSLMRNVSYKDKLKGLSLLKYLSIILVCVSLLNIISPLSKLIVFTQYLMTAVAFYLLIVSICKAVTENHIWRLWVYLSVVFISLTLLAFSFGSNAIGTIYLITSLNSLILLYVIWSFQVKKSDKILISDFSINKEEFPISYWCSAIAIFSLSSLPLTSGFFIKNDLSWLILNQGAIYGHVPFILYLLVTVLLTYCLGKIFFTTQLIENKNYKRMDNLEKYPIYHKVLVLFITIPVVLLGYFALPKSLAGENSRFLQKKLALSITDISNTFFTEQAGNISLIFQIVALGFVIYGVYLIVIGKNIEKYEIILKTKFYKVFEAIQADLYVPRLISFFMSFFVIKPISKISSCSEALVLIVQKLSFVTIDQLAAYLKHNSFEKLDRSIFVMVLGLTVALASIYGLITV